MVEKGNRGKGDSIQKDRERMKQKQVATIRAINGSRLSLIRNIKGHY